MCSHHDTYNVSICTCCTARWNCITSLYMASFHRTDMLCYNKLYGIGLLFDILFSILVLYLTREFNVHFTIQQYLNECYGQEDARLLLETTKGLQIIYWTRYVNPISIVCKYNASSYANTSALATCLDRNMKLANAISQDKSSGSFIFYKQLL